MNHYGLKMGDRMGIEFGTFHTNQVLTLLGYCVPFCLATCFIDEETERGRGWSAVTEPGLELSLLTSSQRSLFSPLWSRG